MWVRKSSIRQVPTYARIGSGVLDRVRNQLFVQSEESEETLDQAFEEFELAQPLVYAHISGVLDGPLGETARALGYFLSLAIWLSFQEGHGRAMKTVTRDELIATSELLAFDSQMRQADGGESLETDDVIAMEQPDLMHFIHEQIEATLDGPNEEMESDHLQAIYQMTLIELLSLSYAVQAPAGFPLSKSEAQA